MRMDGQTDGRKDGQTDMMKLIVTFYNFAKAPKNMWQPPSCILASINTILQLAAIARLLILLFH